MPRLRGTPITRLCLFPRSRGRSFVCDVLFPSLLIAPCLCFSVCPWGNKLLRASAPQAERESSAAVGGPCGQQELYTPSVTAVFSVSSSKQFHKGNACHVLCVSVGRSSASWGPGARDPGAGPRRASALPSLASPAKRLCCIISTCLSEKSKGGFRHRRDFPSLWLHKIFPLILKRYVPQSFYLEDSKHKHKAEFRVLCLKITQIKLL